MGLSICSRFTVSQTHMNPTVDMSLSTGAEEKSAITATLGCPRNLRDLPRSSSTIVLLQRRLNGRRDHPIACAQTECHLTIVLHLEHDTYRQSAHVCYVLSSMFSLTICGRDECGSPLADVHACVQHNDVEIFLWMSVDGHSVGGRLTAAQMTGHSLAPRTARCSCTCLNAAR
jgi:hypothetical protein